MVEKQKESLTKQAVFGSVWNLAGSIVQRIGAFIFTVLLARTLLPEKFGIYNLALSVALIFIVFSNGGINTVFVRYFAETLKNKNRSKAYFKYILKLKVVVALGVSIILAVASYPIAIYVFKKPEVFIPLLLSAGYIFILSLENFFSSFFFAVKRLQNNFYKEGIYQFFRISIVALMFFAIFDTPSVLQVFFALMIAALISMAFVLYNIWRISPHIFDKGGKIIKEDKRRILGFFGYFSFASLSFVFFGDVNTLILGSLIKDATAVGLYQAAFVISSSTAGLLGFAQVLLPIFVELGEKRLENAFNRVFRYSVMLTIPATAGIIVLGGYFLVLIYGYDYIDASLPLAFLSLIVVLSTHVSLFVQLFLAKEKPKDYLPLLLTVIALNVVLSYALITYFETYSLQMGVTGAAIATAFGWIVYAVGISVLANKRLGIKTDFGVIVKPLISSLVMVGAIYGLMSLFGEVNVVKGVLLVLSGIVVYIICMMSTKGIKREDLLLIKDLIKIKRIQNK